MTYFNLQNAKIKAVAASVPDDVEYTTDYNDLFGEEHVRKFIISTGVQRRFTSHRLGVTASDLCCATAEKILTELNYDRNKVDALIFASSSRDYLEPVTATILQDRLGLSDDCMCYDIPLGCSAYVYGLHLAAMHINSGCRSVLLLSGSTGEQLPDGYVPWKSPCFLVMVGLLLYWNMMKMQNQHTDYYDPLVVILRCWFHLLVVKDMLFGLWCKSLAMKRRVPTEIYFIWKAWT